MRIICETEKASAVNNIVDKALSMSIPLKSIESNNEEWIVEIENHDSDWKLEQVHKLERETQEKIRLKSD